MQEAYQERYFSAMLALLAATSRQRVFFSRLTPKQATSATLRQKLTEAGSFFVRSTPRSAGILDANERYWINGVGHGSHMVSHGSGPEPFGSAANNPKQP